MKSMDDALLHYMQDILYAEKASLRVMNKMARAAESQGVKDQFLQHREITQEQVQRLTKAFEEVGKRPRSKTCAAMDGLIEEALEAIEEAEKGPVLDAVLIASMQAMEHYEIARYGAMIAFAHAAGHEDVASLLQETLDEEKEADERLTALAEAGINQKAQQQSSESDEPEQQKSEAPAAEAEPAPEPEAAKPRRGRAKRQEQPVEAPAPEPEPAPAPAKARRAPAKRAAKK
jgi:ferritin-like metal-binding protein YciE